MSKGKKKTSEIDIDIFIKPNGKSLDIREKLFILEYLADPKYNPERAAKKAGYSETTARKKSYNWVGSSGQNEKSYLKEIITKIQAPKLRKLDKNGDYVLQNITKVVERCMQEVEPLLDKKGNQIFKKDEEGNLRPAYVFNATAALKGLELIGKNDGMFVERMRISEDLNVKVVDFTDANYKIMCDEASGG